MRATKALGKLLRKKFDLHRKDGTVGYRLYRAVDDWGPWYDWGKPVMWLVGCERSGSPDAPRGRDLYYARFADLERFQQSWFDGQADRLGFVKTTDFSVVHAHRDMPWKIFDLQDDGRTLLLGYYPEPGSDGRIRPWSIEGNELRLFWRWYLIDHKLKAQWLGLRPWLYYRALHATVHQHKPFSCRVVPNAGTGGYSHWHCELRRRHAGDHRYRNYTWDGLNEVAYDPQEAL